MAPRKREAADDASFEALYARLEEKAKRLEQGNLPLEESLALYEEGAAIVDRLREVLGQAELRVRNVQARMEADTAALRDVEEPYDDEP